MLPFPLKHLQDFPVGLDCRVVCSHIELQQLFNHLMIVVQRLYLLFLRKKVEVFVM